MAVAAEALIELNITQDGPILKLQVLKIKFDTAHQVKLRGEVRDLISSLPAGDRDALSDCEQKFNDLLVIALNVAATTYAPKLVYDINLPVPVVVKTPITPSLLAMNDKIITLGLTADRTAISSQFSARLQAKLAGYYALLAQDIEGAGGPGATHINSGGMCRGCYMH